MIVLILILISLLNQSLPDEQIDTGQNILHNNQVDTFELYQNQETPHFNNKQDPSEKATTQNESELSEETTKNPKSITKPNDSNKIQIPVHNITQPLKKGQTPNDTLYNTHKTIHSPDRIRLQLQNVNHNKLYNEIMILLHLHNILL